MLFEFQYKNNKIPEMQSAIISLRIFHKQWEYIDFELKKTKSWP